MAQVDRGPVSLGRRTKTERPETGRRRQTDPGCGTRPPSTHHHLDHAWLMRMLEERIGDPWILRLIRKWLTAGILEEGHETTPTEGTPQGGPLSPLLANVYLHYVSFLGNLTPAQ